MMSLDYTLERPRWEAELEALEPNTQFSAVRFLTLLEGEQEQDFEQVRGVFESNPFVTAVLQHIDVKTALGNELIERISPLL